MNTYKIIAIILIIFIIILIAGIVTYVIFSKPNEEENDKPIPNKEENDKPIPNKEEESEIHPSFSPQIQMLNLMLKSGKLNDIQTLIVKKFKSDLLEMGITLSMLEHKVMEHGKRNDIVGIQKWGRKIDELEKNAKVVGRKAGKDLKAAGPIPKM